MMKTMWGVGIIFTAAMMTACTSGSYNPVKPGDYFTDSSPCESEYAVGPVTRVEGEWVEVCKDDDCIWFNVEQVAARTRGRLRVCSPDQLK